MRITVRVKTRAREVRVERLQDTQFLVMVKEPPIEGRANQAVVKALAEHFKVALRDIRIVSGTSSKQKILEVDAELSGAGMNN